MCISDETDVDDMIMLSIGSVRLTSNVDNALPRRPVDKERLTVH